MTSKIAYQGEPGANSHIACGEAFPGLEPMACRTFEDCFIAVERGEADLAMIPVENTIAGRVGDIHYLLPTTQLHITGEYYLPIRFQFLRYLPIWFLRYRYLPSEFSPCRTCASGRSYGVPGPGKTAPTLFEFSPTLTQTSNS